MGVSSQAGSPAPLSPASHLSPPCSCLPRPLQPPLWDDSANLPSQGGETRVKKITMSDYKAPTVGQTPAGEIRARQSLAGRYTFQSREAAAGAGCAARASGKPDRPSVEAGRWVARRGRGPRATEQPARQRGSTAAAATHACEAEREGWRPSQKAQRSMAHRGPPPRGPAPALPAKPVPCRAQLSEEVGALVPWRPPGCHHKGHSRGP